MLILEEQDVSVSVSAGHNDHRIIQKVNIDKKNNIGDLPREVSRRPRKSDNETVAVDDVRLNLRTSKKKLTI